MIRHQNINMLFRDAVLVNPAIYQPKKVEGYDPRFNSRFILQPDDTKALIDLGIMPLMGGSFQSNSRFPPIIIEKFFDYKSLILVKQLSEARNVPIERVMGQLKVDIAVAIFEYETPVYKGRGVSLLSIGLNAQEILTEMMGYAHEQIPTL